MRTYLHVKKALKILVFYPYTPSFPSPDSLEKSVKWQSRSRPEDGIVPEKKIVKLKDFYNMYPECMFFPTGQNNLIIKPVEIPDLPVPVQMWLDVLSSSACFILRFHICFMSYFTIILLYLFIYLLIYEYLCIIHI